VEAAPPSLEKLLARMPVASPFRFALNSEPALRLDLAVGNTAFASVNPSDPSAFGRWIGEQLKASGARYAIGGYDENRSMYRMSDVFGTAAEEPRTLHLGVDLWLPASTPVFTVVGGTIHSVQDNRAFGDYGPTVIVEHAFEGQKFFTLYGHLARATLPYVKAGQVLETGEALGWLGAPAENGGWPPHLHFQIIRDLDGRVGDYPGVCRASERVRWLERCPDPNLLLRTKVLK
jgi:murein DD-endopeptidase MepM/ murein hydrolase activator NlpD